MAQTADPVRWVLRVVLGAMIVVVLGGSSLSYYEEQLPSTFNPLFARSMADRRSQELVFDRLYYRHAITNQLRSRLVAQHERIEGGLASRLTLRPEVRWHDGRGFTAVDVCFTVRAMLNPQTPSPVARSHRAWISGCRVEAQHVAVVTFRRRPHDARERLSFAVLPKHLFDSTMVMPDLGFSVRPVGTGPMSAVRGRREVKFTMVPTAHRRAQVRELTMSSGRDPLVQVRSAINGGVHGLISVAAPLRSEIAASDDVVLKSYDLRSWWFVALDPGHPVLSDVRVRQALDLTLDRTQLRELSVGQGDFDVEQPCELISGPFVPSSPFYNRMVPEQPHANLERAAQLMREAGAKKLEDRWVVRGEVVTLRLGMKGSLQGETRDLLNQVANQLRAGGFEVDVEIVQSDEWVRRALIGDLAGDFDALIGKWSFGVVEDVNSLFHTRTGRGEGALNLMGYSDPDVDALLGRYEAARSDTEAQDAYHALHARLAEDLPYLFLWKLDTRSAWRNEVRGNVITPYYYFSEFDRWRR